MRVSTYSDRGTTAASLAPIDLHVKPVQCLTVGTVGMGETQRALADMVTRYRSGVQKSRAERTARYVAG
jgi:hypothetical protein